MNLNTINVDPLRAETKSGNVLGVHEGVSAVFKGIPYAAPPVGSLRFSSPVLCMPWEGERICDHWADDAFRIPFTFGKSMLSFKEPHPCSEDCLYLNIWTPYERDPDEKLPVMFWLYGSGGSSHDGYIDGQALNKEGCILVSVNYRIGIFGFFGIEELAEKSQINSTGNYGLEDILFALKWVNDNISAFGGDPDNITVFGHSAGAIYTKWLIGLKEAKDLFKRGISLSGGGTWDIDYIHSFKSKCDFCRELLERANWSINDILTRSTEEIAREVLPHEKELELPDKSMLNTLFLPSIDDVLVKDYYGKILASGWVNEDIDIMCGMLTEEWHNFPCQIPGGITGFEHEFALSPVIAWAEAYCRRNLKPVYTYFFDRHMPEGGRLMVHGDELPYVFGTLERYSWPWREEDYILSGQVIKYFSNFAKYGDPNGQGIKIWRHYTGYEPVTMHFNDEGMKCEDLTGTEKIKQVVSYLLSNPGMPEVPFFNILTQED